MNELQKKELELLELFVEVCKKLQLRYFLVCGSALGAVKYGGFIPWDDDIDVGMPRADYERFLSEAGCLLPSHVFLQNYRTDPAFPHVFSKLRDSKTTLIEDNMAHLDMNHGVYIDVFPLDGYPSTNRERRTLRYKKKFLGWLHYCSLEGGESAKVRVRNKFFRMLGWHKKTDVALKKLESVISAYPTEGSDIWCNHGNWQGELEYAPVWQYGDGIVSAFEGVDVIIPERYDEYLTQKYGDWRSDPPKEKQKSHHLIRVLDTERPYTEYQTGKNKR